MILSSSTGPLKYHLAATGNMSFVFRGARSDIETGFPDYMSERPAVVSFLLLSHLSALFFCHCIALQLFVGVLDNFCVSKGLF